MRVPARGDLVNCSRIVYANGGEAKIIAKEESQLQRDPMIPIDCMRCASRIVTFSFPKSMSLYSVIGRYIPPDFVLQAKCDNPS